MENIFVINPSATSRDLQAALHEKLLHTKALTTCILFAFKELETVRSMMPSGPWTA